jgi:flagellar motility protein MotE (MotC chaperone)
MGDPSLARVLLAVLTSLLISHAWPARGAGEPNPTAAERREATLQPGEAPSQSPDPLQGPALAIPREVLDMLDQRKQHLDRREASLRGEEGRLATLKSELERLLEKHEQLAAAERQRQEAKQKREEEQKLSRQKAGTDARQQRQTQLAKIYEAMPAEEAAAALERMPERKAIEVLRILKSKSAGAILAAVRPERAARLTEQLLATP